MKNIVFYISVFIINPILLHANEPFDRIEDLQEFSMNKSNLIFQGELISVDSTDETATFRIFEKFKGDYGLDTICFKYRFEEDIDFRYSNGLWLVYVEKTADSGFHFCRGGLSRSLKHPQDLI
jgi:hypothetical protein